MYLTADLVQTVDDTLAVDHAHLGPVCAVVRLCQSGRWGTIYTIGDWQVGQHLHAAECTAGRHDDLTHITEDGGYTRCIIGVGGQGNRGERANSGLSGRRSCELVQADEALGVGDSTIDNVLLFDVAVDTGHFIFLLKKKNT